MTQEAGFDLRGSGGFDGCYRILVVDVVAEIAIRVLCARGGLVPLNGTHGEV